MTSNPRIPRAATDSPAPPSLQKTGLRQQLLAARRALDAPTRARWDQAIAAHVLAWWHTAQPAALGVYWPLRDEPDLQPAYAELARRGAQLLLPVVVAKDAALAFAEWQPGEPMLNDAMGVAVPATLRLAVIPPPALLVPCLGFTAQGYRLGYGGGYYDRTLAHTPRPHTLGIAYQCLQVQFEGDGHDVALDQILTERVLSERGDARTE